MSEKAARLSEFNQLSAADAEVELLRCCGSHAWAKEMNRARPFADEAALFAAADRIWSSLTSTDWLEAFTHHPRIGEKQLRDKFAATAGWAEQEQKGTHDATDAVLTALANGNLEYEKRFGFVFLICATGKTAGEMLNALTVRLRSDRASELKIAAAEQAKITRIRLEKWLNS